MTKEEQELPVLWILAVLTLHLFVLWLMLLKVFSTFLGLFWWQMSWCKQWAGALHSLPPPYEKLAVVSNEWMDCDVPAYLSLFLSLSLSLASFFCYLWNASLHISLCFKPYRTLPSHLINHVMKLNATRQKNPVGILSLPSSRSGVIATRRQVRFSWSRYFAAPIV